MGMDEAEERQRITFLLERWGAVGMGILETLPQTFLLLIAIKFYDAGKMMQSFLATGGSVGLILSPVVVWVVRHLRVPIGKARGWMLVMAGFFMLVAAWLTSLEVYLVCVLAGMVCVTGAIPLSTKLLHANFDSKLRGRLFSWTAIVRMGVGIVFSFAVGDALDADIEYTPYVLAGFALAAFWSGICFLREPSEPLEEDPGHYPYKSLGIIKEDAKFRWILISWYLLGLGNLMMMPLRVIYMVEPEYGFEYEAVRVAVVSTVLPAVGYLISTQIWGRLFDRIHFFVLRLVINVMFVLMIGSFFLISSWEGFLIAGFLHGVAFGGGNVAWSLWVTKLAPAERVADYMSVHTFLTGTRAFMAPILGIQLTVLFVPQLLAWVAIGLIGVASLMLIPEITGLKKVRDGEQWTDSISG